MKKQIEIFKLRSKHIQSQWSEAYSDDGYWIALKPGWKSASDPVGNLHVIHEQTKMEAMREGVMRCDCADCQKP